jgi:hypothetical protein
MHAYSQSSGNWFEDGALLGSGYAGGNCGKTPQGKNNPLMQAVHSVGPIPQGTYDIQGPPFTHPTAGPFCLRLEPQQGTVTFGRAGFMVHGDTNPPGNASEGCVVLPRAVRECIWNAGCLVLIVVASDSDIPQVC